VLSRSSQKPPIVVAGAGLCSEERRGSSVVAVAASLGADIVVVVVVAEVFFESEDVVLTGLGNVPYLIRVMIAATASSCCLGRDAEEGAEEEGRIDFEEGRHSPWDDRGGKERSKNDLAGGGDRKGKGDREEGGGDSKEDGRVPSRNGKDR